jgi:transketolase C-terminal domain/subunit
LLLNLSVDLIITLEEHVLSGGFGSFVLEIAAKSNVKIPIKNIAINQIKLKESGSQNYLRSYHGLDSEGIVKFIEQNL